MISEFLQVLWLLLPAGFANMAPVLFRKVEFLNYPISKKLFGAHKTYRGFFFGVLLAIIAACLLNWGATFIFDSYAYLSVNPLALGALLGFGALFGDLAKSFFKRKKKIKPGKSWAPWDQMDWVIGALIFVNLYVWLNWRMNLLALIVFSLLHPIVNYAGYVLDIKKNKF
jgi:CDP-2,3-bis-(O-geranylgeranyl)-sn-glycerol synthase